MFREAQVSSTIRVTGAVSGQARVVPYFEAPITTEFEAAATVVALLADAPALVIALALVRVESDAVPLSGALPAWDEVVSVAEQRAEALAAEACEVAVAVAE